MPVKDASQNVCGAPATHCALQGVSPWRESWSKTPSLLFPPPPPSTSPTTFTQLPMAGLGHTDKTAQLIALQDQCPWGTLQRLRLCVSFGALEYIKLFPWVSRVREKMDFYLHFVYMWCNISFSDTKGVINLSLLFSAINADNHISECSSHRRLWDGNGWAVYHKAEEFI